MIVIITRKVLYFVTTEMTVVATIKNICERQNDSCNQTENRRMCNMQNGCCHDKENNYFVKGKLAVVRTGKSKLGGRQNDSCYIKENKYSVTGKLVVVTTRKNHIVCDRQNDLGNTL